MDKSKFVFAILLIILNLSTVFALTASMGNVKMVLYPDVYPGETTIINRSIKVNNVNDIEVRILLSTEGNFSNIINIIDGNFTLGVNESRDAKFQILLNESGRYDGKIFVTFDPQGNTINASPVGLASNIIIFAKNSTKPVENITQIETGNETSSSLYALLALVLIIAVGVGVYVIRGRK